TKQSLLLLTTMTILTQGAVTASPAGTAGKPSARTPGSPAQPPQATSWSKDAAEALLAELRDEPELAETKYRAALALANKQVDKKGSLNCLNRLADLLERNGKLPEAAELQEKALTLAETSFSKSSPQYAEELAFQAAFYARKGESGKARELLDQATAILAGSESKFPLAMAACYKATGRRQISEGTFGLADDSFQKALSLEESVLKANDAELISTLREYADLLLKLDRKDDSNKLKERIRQAKAELSLALTGNSGGSSAAPGKSTFAKAFEDAQNADKLGVPEKAIAAWKLVIQEGEKNDSESRLPYAYVHLGDLYSGQKQKDEAEMLYRKGLSLREKNGKDNTLGMARNLKRLSAACLASGKIQEAESLTSKALSIEQKCGADNKIIGSTLQSLLSLNMSNKHNAQAEQTAKQLLEVSTSQQGVLASTNKNMATAMLGSIYMQSGRMDEGMRLMKSMANQAQTRTDPSETAAAFKSVFADIEKQVDESELK
ncbi:MAG: tetratricopeptide repeat protein, partial [Candidatus Obscuribacterales bacterium]|nr:tetratricopeptide repeat protein [Candidatus Obscuribacterales bacterium]